LNLIEFITTYITHLQRFFLKMKIKILALLSIFLLTLLFCATTSARSEPASWFSFINSTDLIVKGEVVSAKKIKSRSGVPHIKIGLKVESSLVLNTDYSKPDGLIYIYRMGMVNPINVGKRGYFFVSEEFGKWGIVDGDIGVWELDSLWAFNKQPKETERVNRRYRVNTFKFRFSVLGDAPDILRQNLQYEEYIDDTITIHEKMFYTEASLLSYFERKPCDFDRQDAATIQRNIKDYFNSLYPNPEASNKYLTWVKTVEFKSSRDIGETCVYRSGGFSDHSLIAVLIHKDKKSVVSHSTFYAKEKSLERKVWSLFRMTWVACEFLRI